MTFCIVVASRPPHSRGQLIAAHPPSCSRCCHAWRRAIVRARLVGVLVTDLARSRNVGQVLVEPRLQLGAERLVLLRVGEVHGERT